MTSLIAILSSGQGTLTSVLKLIKFGEWTQVFLVCDDENYKNFNFNLPNIVKLKIDEKNPQKSIDDLSSVFKSEILDLEVAINFVSGTGLEHMAIISAVMKAGLGMRMVYVKDDKICEMKIMQNFNSDSYKEIDDFLFLF